MVLGYGRSGRLPEIDNQALLQLLESDPSQTTRQIVKTLGCNHSLGIFLQGSKIWLNNAP